MVTKAKAGASRFMSRLALNVLSKILTAGVLSPT
jgi:hypothetical protein